MAAYAALVSLMHIMEQIQNHARLSTSLDKYQIVTLREKLDFLLEFVESYNSHGGISKEEVEDLEGQITSAAHEAEDVIESHIVHQIHAGSNEKSLRCLFDLQKVILDMDSIKEKVIEVEKERGSLKDQRLKSAMPAASSTPVTTGKTTMVGFDSYLHQLLDCLIGQQSYQQIIPITGMGGIGKTTLAKNVYEDSLIVHHFDIRAWVTISQEYNVKKILLEILSCLGDSSCTMDTEDQLGGQLHKILFHRRYLVVLDDMWSIEAWSRIKFFFPQNDNASQIVVTTRQSDIANHFGSWGLAVDFLDDDSSWDLFCQKAFVQEGCPHELEKIGKKIVKKCKGLPLSIIVIGGLLRKSSRTREYWENVEKDLNSILNSLEDNQCLNILSLSYNHLPAYLKPCFLYLGIFPEDHEIRVSQLIKLWVAEGFLKSKKERCLEEVAKDYIKDLIDRNLIIVCRLSSNGKFKTCNIHDLLRDLCIKVAEKEKFFHVISKLDTAGDIDRERRIIIHSGYQVVNTWKSAPLTRSIIGNDLGLLSLKSRLLRVWSRGIIDSPDTTFQLVNLRFLECGYPEMLPSSISLLWNLQTLIITGSNLDVLAPSEIWEMRQLRHLKCGYLYLHDPPVSGEQDGIVLRNLQTLWKVVNFKCSEEVCKRIPNIKKLNIFFHHDIDCGQPMSYYCLYNIGRRLNKLESLSLHYGYGYEIDKYPNRDDMLQNLEFPDSLRKLILGYSNLHWEDLTKVGSLPHLEVLKLDSVIGSQWNPIEGEFLHLKFLEIRDCRGLIYWNADNSHFPVLKKLDLQYLEKLDEIPLGIGEIPTLKDIFVLECSASAAISAIEILEEQENLGNLGLQVLVEFRFVQSKTKLEQVREKVELLGLETHNFQLICPFS